jgi:predicted PhzF superfamily epimerase YddE/YHI9
MKLTMYQIDAFAERVFTGNPAAICPLELWLPDATLQAIAAENNLSETAYFVPEADGFRLRWFTPAVEVDLCGHATLASAFVLYEHLGYAQPAIRFHTRSGVLTVAKAAKGFSMLFPASMPVVCATPPALTAALGRAPRQTLAASNYVAVYDSEEEIRSLRPNFEKLQEVDLHGVIVTAPGREVDFVSRFFAPKFGINEDPVTGSAHCQLTPYWASRLGRTKLKAKQLSARGGSIACELKGDQVVLTGTAIHYMTAEITIPA